MTKKILRSILIISSISVVITAVIVVLLMNSRFYEKAEGELKTEAYLISSGIELNGRDYLDSAEFNTLRVIWISPENELLFDSESKQEDYDSIIKSPEVEEASQKGNDAVSRTSLSVSEIYINYSVRMNDGTVLRISDVRPSFIAQLGEIIYPLLIFTAVAAIASLLLAKAVSKRIVSSISEIDLDNPKIGKSYQELSPLLTKLHAQNTKISSQMAELRHYREQLNLITENMSQGLIIADYNLNILVCSSGALRLLGTDEVREGQSIYSLNDSDAFHQCIRNAAGGRHSECIMNTGNGDRAVIASPSNSIDTVNGIVIFIMDVTEKQQLETMRREFTSNVSHELKTPLTTIYGISDMLANGIVKHEDVAQFGENIRKEADRLITLINDIVALSKLDENSVPQENEEIDLYELAAEVISRLRRSADEKNVSMSIAGEHVLFTGNKTILDEIIFNLCDNAIKYNKDNGHVEVKLSHIPKSVFITVSDTGIGIPNQCLDRIFERFYRVDKSRSRKIKGTGLGLSIVKHGVIYHHGTIRVDSTAGKGSVFTIELPVEKKESVQQA